MNRETFEYILASAFAGYWDWHIPNGYKYFSPVFKQILGYEDHELPNHPDTWQKLLLEEDIPVLSEAYNRHVQSRGAVPFSFTVRYRHKKGHVIHALCRGKVTEWDTDGSPLRMVGSLVDVTETVRRETKLNEALATSSEQNQRLVNFAHVVSHNLRSHAVNLHLLLDLLSDAADEQARRAGMVHLRSVAEKFNNTLEHLNQVVSLQTALQYQKVPLSLDEYLRNTLEVLQGQIQECHATVSSDFGQCPTIEYVPAYLESILLNLISNALKYRHPERRVQVKVLSFVEDGRQTLVVADNGLGIDLQKYGSKLFGMYKTFHRHEQARGIGLFITKSQVEALGGNITVTSQVGEGTVFKVCFN
ncbi:MAG: PAS domain-containing sensor histidine kinase [Cytophagales bacterium]|jgi:PAS domain S-box-containing protein|nr:PAS domain-containing sensor histidine kinase [Cytophagales bacterium]